nr:MAG TPA: hypothetical protein [Caudoviricetes sp.]
MSYEVVSYLPIKIAFLTLIFYNLIAESRQQQWKQNTHLIAM